jgi:hypothetical protein
MGRIIIIALLVLAPAIVWGQDLWFQAPPGATLKLNKSSKSLFPGIKQYKWKRGVLCFGIGFLSGTANGVHEVIHYHYPAFKAMHPKANDQYWNPDESWENKYRNGDKSQGPKFPLSTTLFTGLTDAKHLTGQIHTAGVLSLGVTATIGEKKPWYHYALNILSGGIGYALGFHIIYDRIYRYK